MVTQLPSIRIAIGLVAVLTALAGLMSACSGRPQPAPAPPPALETPLTVETREVEKPVLVTAAPSPTRAYEPRLDAPPGTLVYPLSADPLYLDPQGAADGPQALVIAQLYEGLYSRQADGRLTPAAAESFERSPDSRVYTVTLRSGLVWADGRALRAQDFVDGACRALDPAVGSPAGYLLHAAARLEGASDFASGAQPDCSHVGVRALDEQTLEIRLERPYAAFPEILASRAFLPARPDLISRAASIVAGTGPATPAPDGQEAPAGADASVPPVVGNGAYVLSDWQPGKQLTLVKNQRYWGAESVGIDRIDIPILLPATQLAAYEQGRLHIAEVPEESIQTIISGPMRSELHILPLPGTSYLGFNTAITPTSELAFRQAVAAAIDRGGLLKNTLREPWDMGAKRLLPPGTTGAGNGGPAEQFNMARARELLAKSGYSPDNPPPPVNIWANREGHNLALAEGIVEMLERAGIPARLTTSSWDVYQRSLQTCQTELASGAPGKSAAGGCDYNLNLLGWMMDYPDPARFLGDALGARPATAFSGWDPDGYEALLADARGEPDAERRSRLYDQAEQMLLDAVVDLPLFYYRLPVLAKPGLIFDFPAFGPPQLARWKLPG